MAHGILNTEHLQDIAVNIAPIDPSGGTWSVGSALPLVLDRWDLEFTDESVRVDAGQQGFANSRGVKYDYRVNFTVKAQQDDFDSGKLRDLLYDYRYFRVARFSGGTTTTYDIHVLRFSDTDEEREAGVITVEAEQAYE